MTTIQTKTRATKKYRGVCTKWAAYGTYARVLYARGKSACVPKGTVVPS